MSYLVMDVSKYNTVTDWSSVATQIDGVIIRSGYRGYGSAGTLTTDPSFSSHITGAIAAGIPVSCYFFTQAISEDEAIEEANYFYNLISQYDLSMPVFVDSEYSNTDHDGRADSLSATDRTTYINAFCARMAELGYEVGVYGSDSWFNSMLVQSSIPSEYYKWVAKYSTTAPQYVDDYIAWQYTSSGSIDGVDGSCDLSHWYGDIDSSSNLPEKDDSKYYFDTYTGDTVSIITALDAVGCLDTSYSYRKIIAEDNDITGYSGTSTQNTYMLTLLKNGLLINPSGGDTTAPVITVTSNACGTLTFTVTDDVYVSSVIVDVTSFDLADSYTLTGAGQAHMLYATDAAGNEASLYVETADHNYVGVVTDPTCTEQGYTTYTCSVCGDSYIDDYVEATGHSWVLVDTVEPTCEEQGYSTYLCENCDEEKTDDYTDALGHDWEFTETVEATCTSNGYDLYTCSRCGETKQENIVEATGHTATIEFTWNTVNYEFCTCKRTCSVCGEVETVNCVVTTESDVSCTEGGTIVHTATATFDDGEVYTDVVEIETEATGHNYIATVTDPTCEEQGYTTYTCSVCGDSYIDDYTDALGHEWEFTETVEVGCENDGYDLYTCTRCGATKKENVVEATGHDYRVNFIWSDDGVNCNAVFTCNNCGLVDTVECNCSMSTDAATCEEGGTVTCIATCTFNGEEYTDTKIIEIEATGHNYVTTIVDPTCTEQGYTLHTCTYCGDSYKDSYLPATGHNYELTAQVEATCTEGGYDEYTCSYCGDTYRENETEALGHQYTDTITDPTCTEDGYTTHVCDNCGDTYTDDYTDAHGHTYEITDYQAPSYIEKGYTTYTCSICGDSYTETIDMLDLENAEEIEIVDTKLYALPTSRDYESIKSGFFYVWRDNIINGRVKITNRATNSEVAGLITGWIDTDDINKTIVSESGYKYTLGDSITLKRVTMYSTPSTNVVSKIVTGLYYIALQYAINQRVAITTSAGYCGNEDMIEGWIKYSDIDGSEDD